MLHCYKVGIAYQRYISEVDNYLLTQKHATNTIIIDRFNLTDKPFVFKSSMVSFPSNDPNYWINKEWSYYYNIDSIKIKDK
jgi:hypothetical protein